MGKRRDVRGRNSWRGGDAVEIQPGDVLTTDDILGTDLLWSLPPAAWLRGEASPVPCDVFDRRALAPTHGAMTTGEDIAVSSSRQRMSNGSEDVNRSAKMACCYFRSGPIVGGQGRRDR